jgi:hypothetical protein
MSEPTPAATRHSAYDDVQGLGTAIKAGAPAKAEAAPVAPKVSAIAAPATR